MSDSMSKISVYDLKGKVVDNINIDESVFDGKVNMALLYEAKKMYQANRRAGSASTKTRSHVKGGGAKPWRQKGTGRARFGSSRNPIWRHGGVIFGPHPRDYTYSIPRKALKKALISSINARLSENMVRSIVKLEVSEPKTREFRGIVEALELKGKILFVVDEVSEDIKRSSNNLNGVTLMAQSALNAMDVLNNEHFVIEKDALAALTERLRTKKSGEKEK